MKMVSGWDSLSRGMEWYPSTLFFCLGGTCSASWNGDPVGCVSRLHCEFKCWQSIVLHGFLFFLAVITIVLHQSVGMPIGTGVMIPLFTSSQRLHCHICFGWSLGSSIPTSMHAALLKYRHWIFWHMYRACLVVFPWTMYSTGSQP